MTQHEYDGPYPVVEGPRPKRDRSAWAAMAPRWLLVAAIGVCVFVIGGFWGKSGAEERIGKDQAKQGERIAVIERDMGLLLEMRGELKDAKKTIDRLAAQLDEDIPCTEAKSPSRRIR